MRVTSCRLLAIAASALVCTAGHATTRIIDGTLLAGGDCPLFGDWEAPTKTCRIDDALVEENDVLRILAATVVIDGTLTNEGMLINHGSLVVNGFLNSTNDLVNFWDGDLVNRGQFFSHFMYNFGGLTNEATGVIEFEFHLENNAPLLNYGQIEIGGTFINIPARTLENFGAITLATTATFTNSGLFVHAGTIDNAGQLTNEADFVEHCESLFSGNPIDGLPATPAQALDVGPVTLEWCAIDGADGYDVVRGDLVLLLATDGDFSAATLDCLDDDVATLSLGHGATPAAGEGLWFLVRANEPSGMDYESGFTSQLGSRSDEIAASPHSCP